MARGLGVGFCNIDQPVSDGRWLPARAPRPVWLRPLAWSQLRTLVHFRASTRRNGTTTSTARLNWNRGRRALQNIAQQSKLVFVITNNHFQGKAVANALELMRLIKNAPVRVPDTLTEFYPRLAQIAGPGPFIPPPRQSELMFSASLQVE